MATRNIINHLSKYILRTCNIGKPSGAYIKWKYSLKHDPGARGGGSPWCIPMNKLSLNDAFLVRNISEGPKRNQCYVTAIDIIGRRGPNLDPDVFCCKIWSKIVSYLNKHKICLSQRSLHIAFSHGSFYWQYHFDIYAQNITHIPTSSTINYKSRDKWIRSGDYA